MKLNILLVCACIVMSVFLCSCSSDNTGKLTERDKIELAKRDSAKAAAKNSDIIGEKFEITNGVNAVGDTIKAVTVDNGKLIPDALSYTVTKTGIYSDIAEVGINEDELNLEDSSILDKNGKLKSSVKFFAAEITVKNLKAALEMNITDMDLVYCNSESMSKEADISTIALPVYFSEQNKTEKDYYEYNLAIGQSKKVKVGWYLDTEKYDVSNVYLAFNTYLDEYRSFVKPEF